MIAGDVQLLSSFDSFDNCASSSLRIVTCYCYHYHYNYYYCWQLRDADDDVGNVEVMI